MTKKQTKRIIRILLFVGTAISLFFVPWILVRAWIRPLPDTIQEQLEEGIQYGFDGMIAYVDEAGKPPAFYAAGWKDREKKIPADPHALFKIASVGKLYDAVAITKLVYAGRLSLDSTLAYYMPKLVGRIQYADKITLRMMVEHRSGIPNLTSTPNFWTNPPKTSEEALQRVLDLPADFKPGKDYEYSNTNYLLIGEIIQKVTGESKFQYIKKSILDPLGLKHTFGSIHDVNMNDLMSGYYVGVKQDIKDTDYSSMIATAQDVGTFLRALNDGSLFTDKKEQEIYSSIYRYNHTGLVPGYQTIAKYFKDIDTVVIQFNNTTNFDGYDWNLAEIIYNRVVRIIRRQRKS
ncbi:serine hydrolase domain-containing protein [Prolixibacter denitrificans]|uniref:Beta-lactamase n=1 Tax=Prolixibacter denitrificans TaxID=1541063 RepID=A0A2P8CF92_9BACT|nr:serine hydrolase domain-containing protein [Prolixibacter denitrificans]PSK83645.1 beta-lactamase [Prolixibacter denitrificans]GET23193.1 serine-type D-Ala-D-Ala carboxypeptidase [Prolixibacter denitrificans]